MGKRQQPIEAASPFPQAYHVGQKPEDPKALEREIVTRNQINQTENTLQWGEFDDEPLRILNAVNESPIATSCLETVEMFTRGSGFSDPGLMTMPVDKDGTTLWDFHCQNVQYMSLLKGFCVNFKFDSQGKITNSYNVGLETGRFVGCEDQKTIEKIKINPYWGTKEYKPEHTKEYNLWNPEKLDAQIKLEGTQFPGQIYFYGNPRPPYKFYPLPKYWTGKKWIYSDAKIATYVDELLGNGFFQSVLMTVIGDPNQMSKNPKLMKEVVGDDNVKRKQAVYTKGEEFDMQMSKNFSGVHKAGTAFVKWALNKDDVIQLQEFPSTADFAFVEGVAMLLIRMISIATQVPAILANLPAALSSLASGGDAIKNSTDLMQSTVKSDKTILEGFYNNVMLPNLQKPIKTKLKIMDYVPIRTQVTVDDKFWDVMTDSQKKEFIKDAVPGSWQAAPEEAVTAELDSPETLKAQAALRGSVGGVQGVLSIQAAVVSKTTTLESAISILTIIYGFTQVQAMLLLGAPKDESGQPVQPDTQTQQEQDKNKVNEALKGLKISEINRIGSIVNKFEAGKLTEDQAKQLLGGYGLSEEQINAWLHPTETTDA